MYAIYEERNILFLNRLIHVHVSLCKIVIWNRSFNHIVYICEESRREEKNTLNIILAALFIVFLQVFISNKSLTLNNYERQEKSCRLVACRTRHDNDPKSFSILSLETSIRTVCNTIFKPSVF